jgi:hypothetical protein
MMAAPEGQYTYIYTCIHTYVHTYYQELLRVVNDVFDQGAMMAAPEGQCTCICTCIRTNIIHLHTCMHNIRSC